jgi:hypothetical protein
MRQEPYLWPGLRQSSYPETALVVRHLAVWPLAIQRCIRPA